MQMENNLEITKTIFTNIPLVDIVINIDLFTAHFEDRNKVLRIVKELFNHCTTMKKLLLKHGKLILPALLRKYDKQCHLYINKARSDGGGSGRNSKRDAPAVVENSNIAVNRDEYLAVIVGQLIRLYAKSKSMSQTFCNFALLEHVVKMMSHEQHII